MQRNSINGNEGLKYNDILKVYILLIFGII